MSDSATMMPAHPPVTDWVHDFDHTDPRWTENPFPIWDELRAECPVVQTKRFLGCYLPTTYEAVKQVAYDTEHFSSRRVIVRDVRPDITQSAPPITSDPPQHKPAKQLLLPPFTPDAMKRLEPRVRAICNELIDEFIGRVNSAIMLGLIGSGLVACAVGNAIATLTGVRLRELPFSPDRVRGALGA